MKKREVTMPTPNDPKHFETMGRWWVRRPSRAQIVEIAWWSSEAGQAVVDAYNRDTATDAQLEELIFHSAKLIGVMWADLEHELDCPINSTGQEFFGELYLSGWSDVVILLTGIALWHRWARYLSPPAAVEVQDTVNFTPVQRESGQPSASE